MQETVDFHSKHFTLFQLSDGILAAIASEGGHAICNSGVIDLGGQLLVFDTFVTPHAALDLRRYILGQFGRPPQMVINSHYHNDHVWGNQVFSSEAQIISSIKTRQLLASAGMEEYKWYASNSLQQLESLRAQYQSADDQQRKQLVLLMGEYEGIVEALPHLAIGMPTVTFDSRLEVHGLTRSGLLSSFEGHTGSDTVLHLPQDGVVFAGDLLFVSCHPYLGDGDPKKLVTALQELDKLGASTYVPGHGPVGTIDDVRRLKEYVEGCMNTAEQLVNSGDVSKERIMELSVPKPFQSWDIPQFYASNIGFLCQTMSQGDDLG